MKRVGILGGTFDPIHLGHLLLAEEARTHLALEMVLFVPTGQPWLRRHRPISPSHHRVAMARLAVADNPAFAVSTLEVDRPGPTYTVDTLDVLHRQYGEGAEFYFLLGSDALQDLPRWKEPARLLTMCRLVVFPRPGAPPVDLSLLDRFQEGASQRAVALSGPLIGISGSEIRRRAAQDLSIRYWVPRPVEEYILGHGLYRDRSPL